MSTPITLVIFPDPDAWLRENVRDFATDGVAAVQPTEPICPGGITIYEDSEEETEKVCSWQDHLDALRLLTEQIGRTLFVGGLKSPFDLVEPGNWDAEVVDAFFQLVYRKEVIYG